MMILTIARIQSERTKNLLPPKCCRPSKITMRRGSSKETQRIKALQQASLRGKSRQMTIGLCSTQLRIIAGKSQLCQMEIIPEGNLSQLIGTLGRMMNRSCPVYKHTQGSLAQATSIRGFSRQLRHIIERSLL